MNDNQIILELQNNSPGDDVDHETKGAKILLEWWVNSGNNLLYRHDSSDLSYTSILSSTSEDFIYITNLSRTRIDTNYENTDELDISINIITEKIQTTSSSKYITDQYGIWFNNNLYPVIFII